MLYRSTRSNERIVASKAILNGLASDGGLYIFDEIIDIDISEYYSLSYLECASKIISLYFKEFDPIMIKNALEKSYKSFESKEVVELKDFSGYSYLELFHGQTLAFKDLALSSFFRFLELALELNNESRKVLILSATSGDTGKAAMEAAKNIENIDICIVYPDEGVSKLQLEQMQKQEGKNVLVLGIRSNFDEGQSMVKKLFLDSEFKDKLENSGYILSSANSINIARLIPQIVYYVYAYQKLVTQQRVSDNEQIDVYVPTGNFGNILAAFIAKKMGVPIGKIICASNENNVLVKFFNTGIYDINVDFKKTYSPSMDILISSNLERFLFLVFEDYQLIKGWMFDLEQRGRFVLTDEQLLKIQTQISAIECSNEQCINTIKESYLKDDYLIDPHTANAKYATKYTNSKNYKLIVGTASIYKFLDTMNLALDLEVNEKLSDKLNLETPYQIKKLEKLNVRFDEIINVGELEAKLLKFIEGRKYDEI